MGDRVLVKPEQKERMTKVGLYLPANVVEKEEVQGGKVIAIGPGQPLPPANEEQEPWKDGYRNPRFLPMQARLGDYALFFRKAAIEMFEGESGRADPLEIEVQGRVLRAAHVDDEMNNAFAGSDIDVEGQGVLVELTQEGGRPLLLIYSTKEHPEEVPLEEVVEFLEPFHVGPGR